MKVEQRELTKEETKIIKKELLRKIFPSITITLALFLIVFLVFTFRNSYGNQFVYLSISTILGGILSFLIFTLNLRKDIAGKTVYLEETIIEEHIHAEVYEPGSGALTPAALLAPLFFSEDQIRTRNKKFDMYYVKIDGEKYYTKKEIFEKVRKGSSIYIKRAPSSKLYLGIQEK